MWEIKTVLIVGAFLVLIVTFFVLVVRQFLFAARRAQEFFQAPPVSKEFEPPGNAFIESPLSQRLIALLMVGAGAFGTMWLRHQALRGNEVRFVPAILFPFAAVLGLGGILFPHDFDAQRWKYGRGKPRTWEEMPTPMKVYVTLALCAGLVNLWALMSR
ncbi:hypothetical protein VT84_03210 [Gemmata sp. SH-PL17]|uniref:hypothetical protein n=1 Tax=Gemmata sp. SH-PL17 TaxID=1630693 RepID=UPI00078E6057|nr:hypothetical protein [Gemmata sp. SH-PL17]AMV23391.1 hypothetical protein VT84_03210 [Gemmata sp. SH-PL17]